MNPDRMALAVGCAAALALAAPAVAAKGDTLATDTYAGAKLSLKVAKKSMTLSEVDQPVVKGSCLVSDTGARSQRSFSLGTLKFKGKRPRIGFKHVRKIHSERKNPTGPPETTDYKLTVRFSTATKAKITVGYKSKADTTTCTAKGSDTVRPK